MYFDAVRKYYQKRGKDKTSDIISYDAFSMSDIYAILWEIGQEKQQKDGKSKGGRDFQNPIRPLWFRGQSKEEFTLIPSLFRGRENNANAEEFYSTLSLAEEYRHQNFSARVNHLTSTRPDSRVEWQEILQHHFGKTRFMDWSESVEIALNFALEPFIDTKDTEDNRLSRSGLTPGIWVLNPYRLNEKVYDFFCDKEKGLELIMHSLKSLISCPDDIEVFGNKLKDEMNSHKNIYFNLSDQNIIDSAINGIVSVCVLDNHYHYNGERMQRMLENFEFNPFFFLLVRYYADALPVKADVNTTLLPPLASIQPYHSERIRAQRGTFTIFPNYYRTKEALSLMGTKMDVIAVESQRYISDCFCYIRLCDHVRIARELIYAGERRPVLYPDIQIYADYLETQKFYL